MKSKFLLVLAMAAGSTVCSAQNLVPNGSFEEGINCPSFIANLDEECLNWYASIVLEDASKPTPDWFHSCSELDGLAPPDVVFGTQLPADGDGYAGIVTYDSISSIENYREIIGTQLTSSLIQGQEYLVEFKVSSLISTDFAVATNNIGFNFSTHQYFFAPAFPTNTSHFSIDSILTLSDEWTQVSQVFLADSNYNYLHIGNFYDDASTDVSGETEVSHLAYYVIDDVAVSQLLNSYSQEDRLGPYSIYPNPVRNTLKVNLKERNFVNRLRIHSLAGKMLFQENLERNLNTISIDVSSLLEGIYFLVLETNNQLYYEKFIKL
jgi:hypothetical protein